MFYDIFKLELPRGSFGGDKWLITTTLDTRDCSTQIADCECPPACPGTQTGRPTEVSTSVIRHSDRIRSIRPQADEAAGSHRRLDIS